MRTIPFTLIILSLVACTTDLHSESQPEFNEPVSPAEPSPEELRSSRMRRATAAFDCLVATETIEDLAACADGHRSADAAAAYDLMICGQFYCIDCFDTSFALLATHAWLGTAGNHSQLWKTAAELNTTSCRGRAMTASTVVSISRTSGSDARATLAGRRRTSAPLPNREACSCNG